MTIENLFKNLPENAGAEHFQTLISSDSVRIERIISFPNNPLSEEWYDQEEHEWVMVLQGNGVIVFDDYRIVTLNAGDHLNIPAHQKHRVVKTSKDEATIWLAAFYK